MATEDIVNDVEIFVPGRLCILGEHSDWAAEFRTDNPSISYGKKSPATTTIPRSNVLEVSPSCCNANYGSSYLCYNRDIAFKRRLRSYAVPAV